MSRLSLLLIVVIVSNFCISSSLRTSKRLSQVSFHSLNQQQQQPNNSYKNMDLFFKRDSMESGFSPIFREKSSVEFTSLSNRKDIDYEESQTLLSASSSSNIEDVDIPSKGLLPPWLPSFTTACLGGLLFGSDIGTVL